MSNEWNNLNGEEITEACNYLNVNIEKDKFIYDLSYIENTGKIVKRNKKYTTYELNYNGNIYHIKISIDNENKKRLEKINNIPFNMLKYERALKQWAFIPEKDMNNKMNNIDFLERKFGSGIIKYLAYIFYIKAGIGNISAELDNFKQISDLINYFIITENNEYFKCIDKNKYIIMDLILTHESKRVFCIFKENTRPNMQPYELVQICTKSKILYNTDNKNGNILLSVNKSDYPKRNVQIVKDDTLISFKDAKISFKDNQNHDFYKHITDDKHWERLKKTYEEKFKNLDENKELSEDEVKRMFKKLLRNKIDETFDVNKERELRIPPADTSIYIRNLESKFFPTVRTCVFLEINLLGDLYYLVLSCYQSDLTKKYTFTAETLYTKEMYENRFKME